MSNPFKISEKINRLKATKTELPRQLADFGQRYFQMNFDKAQWNGVRWEQRKADSYYAKKMYGHALLVGRTGDLRRALQNTIISFDWNKITWAVKDVSYASYVNNGTDNMPARKYIGLDGEIQKGFTKKIESEFKKIME